MNIHTHTKKAQNTESTQACACSKRTCVDIKHVWSKSHGRVRSLALCPANTPIEGVFEILNIPLTCPSAQRCFGPGQRIPSATSALHLHRRSAQPAPKQITHAKLWLQHTAAATTTTTATTITTTTSGTGEQSGETLFVRTKVLLTLCARATSNSRRRRASACLQREREEDEKNTPET